MLDSLTLSGFGWHMNLLLQQMTIRCTITPQSQQSAAFLTSKVFKKTISSVVRSGSGLLFRCLIPIFYARSSRCLIHVPSRYESIDVCHGRICWAYICGSDAIPGVPEGTQLQFALEAVTNNGVSGFHLRHPFVAMVPSKDFEYV